MRVQSELEKSLKDGASAGKQFGDALGTSLAGVIDGTKSLGTAFAGMAKSVVSSLIEMAIKTITTYATVGAGAAAFSQMGIPVIGPFLAVGAAAAAGALIMGLMANIPKAAGGYDIPTGINPLVQAHGGEMILPEKYADVLRSMADKTGGKLGGGQAQGALTLNINAIDGASVMRMVESQDFQRAMREAQRTGAM